MREKAINVVHGSKCGRVNDILKQTTVYRNEKEDIMANIHVTFNKYGM